MDYNTNISIESTISIQCNQITVQSIGDSTYDGWYERYIFGTYRIYQRTDPRGNYIYHANIQDTDWFIIKDTENYWVVSVAHLNKFETELLT